jgi:hypothetical protein
MLADIASCVPAPCIAKVRHPLFEVVPALLQFTSLGDIANTATVKKRLQAARLQMLQVEDASRKKKTG